MTDKKEISLAVAKAKKEQRKEDAAIARGFAKTHYVAQIIACKILKLSFKQ